MSSGISEMPLALLRGISGVAAADDIEVDIEVDLGGGRTGRREFREMSRPVIYGIISLGFHGRNKSFVFEHNPAMFLPIKLH